MAMDTKITKQITFFDWVEKCKEHPEWDIPDLQHLLETIEYNRELIKGSNEDE